MSATVLQGSRSVVLEIPVAADSSAPPRCDGIMLALVRASGTCEAGVIEVVPGAFAPFDGETWRVEWRKSETGWTLAVGVPDSTFSGAFDPAVLMSIEAVDAGDAVRLTSLGAASVTVASPVHAGDKELPAWLPEEWAPSAEQQGF